jgi:hypothetical protein
VEIGATDYDQFVVLDEFYQSESHVEDAIAWLNRNDKPEGHIFCEHEPAEIRKFRQAGYAATEAEKSIDPGIAEVRRRPSRDDTDRVGLLVSDRCQHAIREFLGYKEEHVGTSQAEGHICDSIRYVIFTNEHKDGGIPTGTVRYSGDMSDMTRNGVSFL